MIINVKVFPNSKTESLEQIGTMDYVIRVKERAIEGRANAAVIAAVADYFGVSRRYVSIVRGSKSRKKVVEIFA